MCFLYVHIDYKNIFKARPEPLECLATSSHFVVKNRSESIQLYLRKRDHAPLTYCQRATDGNVELGYTLMDRSGDYLQIIIQADGGLIVRRDIQATLPVAYAIQDGQIWISNSYEEVARSLPRLTLRLNDIANILATHESFSPTLWQEIQWLNAEEVLNVYDGIAYVSQTNARSWSRSNDVAEVNPKEYFDRMDSTLSNALHNYAGKRPLGFELSGGLDSPLMPLFLAKNVPQDTWHTTSIVLPEPFKTAQLTKLNSLRSMSAGIVSHIIEPDYTRHQPLARMFQSQTEPQLFYPFSDLYIELADEMAYTLQAEGVGVVFNGAGGDDLLEHNDSQDDQLAISDKGYNMRKEMFPVFGSKKLDQLLRKSVQDRSVSKLPKLSVSLSQPVVQNNVYIERDIWPVSPLANVELFNYCQGLPYQFRKNKAIVRRYYRAKNYPAAWYDGTLPNEDFAGFFDKALLSADYQSLVAHLTQNSFLHTAGYVNTLDIAALYNNAQRGGILADGTLFAIYLWIALEMNLLIAYRHGQWDGKID